MATAATAASAHRRHGSSSSHTNRWSTLTVIDARETWQTILDRTRQQMAASLTARPRLIIVHHVDATTPFTAPALEADVLEPLDCLLRSRGCRLVRTTLLRDAAERATSAAFYHRVPQDQYRNWIGEHAANSMVAFILNNRMRARRHNRTLPMTTADLQQARRALANFDAIGRTEELDAFLEYLSRLLDWNRRSQETVVSRTNSSSLQSIRTTRTIPSHGSKEVQVKSNETPQQQKYALTREEVAWTRNHTRLDDELIRSLCVTYGYGEAGEALMPSVASQPCRLAAELPQFTDQARASKCTSHSSPRVL